MLYETLNHIFDIAYIDPQSAREQLIDLINEYYDIIGTVEIDEEWQDNLPTNYFSRFREVFTLDAWFQVNDLEEDYGVDYLTVLNNLIFLCID